MLRSNQLNIINVLIDALESDKDVVLTGPEACGKSYLINELEAFIGGRLLHSDGTVEATSDLPSECRVRFTSEGTVEAIGNLPTECRVRFTSEIVPVKYLIQTTMDCSGLNSDRFAVIAMISNH